VAVTGKGVAVTGTPHWLLTYVVRVTLPGSETGGAFAVAEYLKPPGDWTPLHVHQRESQTTYVIDGQATVHLPEGPLVLDPGECAYQPKGVPHTEAITSNQPARVLDIYAPAGFERWVSLAGVPTDRFVLPPAPEAPDEARVKFLLEVTAELGLEVVGAPGELPY
jgi:mannose-6-phosphate isomerase-like protein (cupin superfamily)